MSEIVRQIVQEFNSGKTSGSWLICGPRGIGKKSLVKQVAQELFGKNTSSLISGIKWVECGLTEEAKKNIQKAIQSGEIIQSENALDKKSEITIEEMRQGLDFISLKSPLPCKILAISLAEEMNENVQNALLKTLEEPFEKTLIFLLSENPNKLLPTILSRCKRIVLHTLSNQEMLEMIKNEYPDCSQPEMVVQLSDGMPGIAKQICLNNGLILYENLMTFMCPIENLDLIALSNFIQLRTKEENILLFHYVLKFLYHQAQGENIEQANRFSQLYSLTETQISKMKDLYLDPNQVLLDLILKITEFLK